MVTFASSQSLDLRAARRARAVPALADAMMAATTAAMMAVVDRTAATVAVICAIAVNVAIAAAMTAVTMDVVRRAAADAVRSGTLLKSRNPYLFKVLISAKIFF